MLSFKTRLPFDRLPAWREVRALPLAEQGPMPSRDPGPAGDAGRRGRPHGDYGRAIGAETRQARLRLAPRSSTRPPCRRTRRWPRWPSAAARTRSSVMIDLALATDFDQFFVQLIGNERPRVPAASHDATRGPWSTFSDSGAHVSQIMDSLHPDPPAGPLGPRPRRRSPGGGRAQAHLRAGHGVGLRRPGPRAEGSVADLNVFDPDRVGPDVPDAAPTCRPAPSG